jgi:HNH endonuclease/AP2 domain
MTVDEAPVTTATMQLTMMTVMTNMNDDDLLGDEFIYPRFIPLTKGQIAVVDHWSYDAIVAMGQWYYSGGYACRRNNVGGQCRMHRVVLELAGVDLADLDVDHWNGDKTDNRLCNLRPCTPQQNAANSKSYSKTSRFKGIYLHKPWGRWQARYKLDGKERSLGYFRTEEEAARAYDAKMLELWGHWAKLNFKLDLPYEYSGPKVIKRTRQWPSSAATSGPLAPMPVGHRRRQANNKSGFSGVYQRKAGKWIACISVKGKWTYLGTADTAEEAARMREARASVSA